MTQQQEIEARVARVFAPLMRPSRYKGAYGGRGSGKSHFYAESLILRCYANHTRAVCIREIQQSIRDSVRQLLVDKIQMFGLGGFFEVLDNEIRGRNGSLVIFRGMQSFNAENIKSLEAYDIAWVEEAQTLSARSLELLRPTIRKPGSEIWFSWNPRNPTDPVDVFFRKNLPSDAVAVMANWRDNPWFPDVLEIERKHDIATDPNTAEHIWEGAYGIQKGSILGRWLAKAEREGRVNNNVVYDPGGSPVDVSSDIGFRDTASWWFWQRSLGGFSLLKYEGDSGLDADEWIQRIADIYTDNEWKLGRIWLPQDAKAKTFQSRHSAAERFLKMFKSAHCSIVPRAYKSDRINAARHIMDSCRFNADACEEGINGLRAWEFEFNYETQAFSREPLHNWASHPGDGFSYGAQVMRELVEPVKVKPKPIDGMENVTLDHLWKDAERRPGSGMI